MCGIAHLEEQKTLVACLCLRWFTAISRDIMVHDCRRDLLGLLCGLHGGIVLLRQLVRALDALVVHASRLVRLRRIALCIQQAHQQHVDINMWLINDLINHMSDVIMLIHLHERA